MKKILVKSFIYLILVSIGFVIFFSCNKSHDSTSASSNSFTWTYNGTLYTANLDTAYLNSMIGGPLIIAGLGSSLMTPGSGPRITLTGFNAGTYTFGLGSSNLFRYVDVLGNNIDDMSGSLNITMNANNLLSGNFLVTLYNSNTISGNFTNTPIRP